MRKKLIFIMCFCLLIGLLSACKKDSESSSPATTEQTTNETTNETTNVAGQTSQSGYKEEKIELPKENGGIEYPDIMINQGRIEFISQKFDEKSYKITGYYKSVLQDDKSWQKEETKWSSEVVKKKYTALTGFVSDGKGSYYAVGIKYNQLLTKKNKKVDYKKIKTNVIKLNEDGTIQDFKLEKVKVDLKEGYEDLIDGVKVFSDETAIVMLGNEKYYLYDLKTGKMKKEYQDGFINDEPFLGNNSILTLNETKNAIKVIDKDTEETLSEIPLKEDKSITINDEVSSYALATGADDTCYIISENGIQSASDSDTECKQIVEKGKLSAFLLNGRRVLKFMVGNNNDFYYVHMQTGNNSSSERYTLDHVYSEGK